MAPTDLSLGMLRVGKQRRPDLPFVAGDALRLPYADAAFDAVTISFGLRNVEDPEAACAELRRVTRPGGTPGDLRVLHPDLPAFRWVYDNYLVAALPRIARLISSNPAAYEYLAESIQAWPDQPGLAALIGRGGLAATWSGATCPAASSPCTGRRRDQTAPAERGHHGEHRPTGAGTARRDGAARTAR